jgi:acyl carrier protein
MAASLEQNRRSVTEQSGVTSLTPEQGISALAQAIGASNPQVAVLAANWSKILQGRAIPPFLSQLVRERTAKRVAESKGKHADAATFHAELMGAPIADRAEIMLRRVRQHTSQVMALTTEQMPESAGLGDLGLDSLIAVELKNRLDGDLRASVSIEMLFSDRSLGELAVELASMLADVSSNGAPAAPATGSNHDHGSGADLDIDNMADSEVESMLMALLNQDKGSQTL